jgi:hypothetical protein
LKQAITSSRQNPWNQAYGGDGTITMEIAGTVSYYHGTAGTNAQPYMGSGTGRVVTTRNVINCIAVARGSSSINWYSRGELSSTRGNSYPTASSSVNSILLGTGYAGAFNGTLYSVLAYSRQLTSTEIRAASKTLQSIHGF